MQIVRNCDAADVNILFVSALLAFPGAWRAKAALLLGGLGALVAANVLRICSLYGTDAFLTRVSSAGSSLDFSTYLGARGPTPPTPCGSKPPELNFRTPYLFGYPLAHELSRVLPVLTALKLTFAAAMSTGTRMSTGT